MDNAFSQIVQLSAQKVLMAPVGTNPRVQEGALSLIIKAFVPSVLWENSHTAQQYTYTATSVISASRSVYFP